MFFFFCVSINVINSAHEQINIYEMVLYFIRLFRVCCVYELVLRRQNKYTKFRYAYFKNVVYYVWLFYKIMYFLTSDDLFESFLCVIKNGDTTLPTNTLLTNGKNLVLKNILWFFFMHYLSSKSNTRP